MLPSRKGKKRSLTFLYEKKLIILKRHSTILFGLYKKDYYFCHRIVYTKICTQDEKRQHSGYWNCDDRVTCSILFFADKRDMAIAMPAIQTHRVAMSAMWFAESDT